VLCLRKALANNLVNGSGLDKQKAQLPQRDSASATYAFLGSLTDRTLHCTPHLLLYNYNRLAKLESTPSANKPCNIRTFKLNPALSSFKVIHIGAGRNPERCVVVMCNYKITTPSLSRFGMIPACDERTDRQTDGRTDGIYHS